MRNELWIILAAQYPPHNQDDEAWCDHQIMRAAVQQGVAVTVWCEDAQVTDVVYEGVVVHRTPTARQQFYADSTHRHPDRVFLAGPITVTPWKITPATRPVLLLRDQSYLPLVRQLAPILDGIVVPSQHFKDTVLEYQPTFSADQIHVSYPNLPAIEPLARRNPRFITTVSAADFRGIELFMALAAATPHAEFLVAAGNQRAAVQRVRIAAWQARNLFISEHHRSQRQIHFISKVVVFPTVPSLYVETFGMALAAALLHDVPVLTYRVGAPQEYLDERLFVPRDEQSLAGQLAAWQEKLLWCNEHPDELMEAVRLSARRLRELQLPYQASLLVHILRTAH